MTLAVRLLHQDRVCRGHPILELLALSVVLDLASNHLSIWQRKWLPLTGVQLPTSMERKLMPQISCSCLPVWLEPVLPVQGPLLQGLESFRLQHTGMPGSPSRQARQWSNRGHAVGWSLTLRVRVPACLREHVLHVARKAGLQPLQNPVCLSFAPTLTLAFEARWGSP